MDIEAFIERWTSREGGAERANYQMYICELCDLISVARPEPAGCERDYNDYAFERAVRRRPSDEIASCRRIDLYKRGCFILEAKQSRLPGGRKALPDQSSLLPPARTSSRRAHGENWDAYMRNARQQAEGYVHLLEPDHPAPPFVIVCDVGRAFELFADFSGTGRAYTHFPDRKRFRIRIEDLRDPQIRALLARVWDDPYSLDPARQTAFVTRNVAARLAAVSRSLEGQHHPEDVALFLMRCIFCMFAEDVDLLPKGKFTKLLEECLSSPATLIRLLGELWQKMDNADRRERFFSYFASDLRHFNGNLYRDARVLPLGRDDIAALIAAAKHSWIEVDPAIFGTLLEQALDPDERRKLGAHYTPRVYVERLVEATVMEPLRADWKDALKQAEDAVEQHDLPEAISIVGTFHRQLCATRVLDPACGTGNFLYVSLELMKKLEGEVLETLASLGDTESLGLERDTVGPHQFLGIERNPRAAAIADLVIWIGYLQQHYRMRTGHPKEPILRAVSNINAGERFGKDALVTWDGAPGMLIVEKDGKRIEFCPGPKRVEWPQAEFIVGNPPFLGGKDLRARLGDAYAEALWQVNPQMNESADLVMYWWDRAAELLTSKDTRLRRFGFVTTNSISQLFQRRTVERHLSARNPVGIIMAIPDHPWTKAARDSAAVRIAMTVVEAGRCDGLVQRITNERALDLDDPILEYLNEIGPINADLTIGTDVGHAQALQANRALCTRGVALHGGGFLVSPTLAQAMGLGQVAGLEKHIRSYRHGKDLTGRQRGLMVIDLEGLEAAQVRDLYPLVYQHVLEHVKPVREQNNEPYRKLNWWKFGRKHTDLRSSLAALPRYIATVETAKHRVFQFLDGGILSDNKIVCIALDDAADLAVLHSSVHAAWYLANSGMLGVYAREAVYVKSRCFDPFPFPDAPAHIRDRLRAAGEELDALRKRVLEDNPDVTLTGLYNVLEKLKAGEALTPKEADVKRRCLVLILQELHETIDRLTTDAYGWKHGLKGDEIIERLVALNLDRAREEADGYVRWLRPDYQAPRFARQDAPQTKELDLVAAVIPIDRAKAAFPKERNLQRLAIEAVVNGANSAMDAASVARSFRNGGRRIEPRVAQILLNLAIYGHIYALPDGRFIGRENRSFSRHAA